MVTVQLNSTIIPVCFVGCGSLVVVAGPFRLVSSAIISRPSNAHSALNRALCGDRYVYFEKIRVLKAGVKQGALWGLEKPRIMLHGIIKYDLGSVLLVFGTS